MNQLTTIAALPGSGSGHMSALTREAGEPRKPEPETPKPEEPTSPANAWEAFMEGNDGGIGC